ncbi:MAG TPA: hypothetical protein VF353_10770, partial [Candidatus Binatia bacterium]
LARTLQQIKKNSLKTKTPRYCERGADELTRSEYVRRQVVVVDVDEDSDLAGAVSFLVSVFVSLLSFLDSDDEELAPFSVLGASLPLRA